jgi:DNA-directed RNA polymerase subunit RPC12/RpoP
MPLRWATLFRLFVLLMLTAHEFAMYHLARRMGGAGIDDINEIVLACLFALAMLVPLVWAVTLPELPEIYMRVVRARRWFRQGRCPSCGYRIGSANITTCPECGARIIAPREYVVTRSTILRYAFLNALAWVIGCGLAELYLRINAAN